jgi:membrane protein DedA with SNARE-associated domain
MLPRTFLSALAPVSLLAALPALAAHTGVTRRNGYSWSDAAIFGVVVVALILARRALRRRLRTARRDTRD